MSIALPFTSLRKSLGPRCAQYIRVPTFQKLLSWPALDQRALATAASPKTVPYRKQVKDEARQRRLSGDAEHGAVKKMKEEKAKHWELTVGIEVHAQLNTERKLFSRARTSIDAEPNSRVALFDLAYPGTQPEFQRATLIPALRAAIALKCSIQPRSRFDRKHYFYPDQPAGYQITQYYEPFAKDGLITLYDHDGIAPEDGETVTIGIKQIQMEQDTAKTIQQPPSTTLLDFNRVSHPLIEIITLPHIHHPQTAAACVKKVQALLEAVNAVFTGMEMGGLRADVNVSVRQNKQGVAPLETHSYHGVSGLGQRTEIKNLSSFKAIEDAIVAERDRQIDILESGGIIDGETRGWALGSTETTRLRGKEGEVDYRYMPDPDLAPVIIGQDLIEHISNTLPELPDDAIRSLVNELNLTLKDAKILVASESQRQLLYFDKTLWSLVKMLQPNFPTPIKASSKSRGLKAKHARVVANWIVHELPGLIAVKDGYCDWDTMDELLPVAVVARVLENLLAKRITGQIAKKLLAMKLKGDKRDVRQIIGDDNLKLRTVSHEEYMIMAKALIDAHPDLAQKAQQGQSGKLMWFVGQMMRQGKGSIEAEKAKSVLEESLKRDTEQS